MGHRRARAADRRRARYQPRSGVGTSPGRRGRAGGPRMAPPWRPRSRSCSNVATPSPSQCLRTCRQHWRGKRRWRASTCCSRSRWPSTSRTPNGSPPPWRKPGSARCCSSPTASRPRFVTSCAGLHRPSRKRRADQLRQRRFASRRVLRHAVAGRSRRAARPRPPRARPSRRHTGADLGGHRRRRPDAFRGADHQARVRARRSGHAVHHGGGCGGSDGLQGAHHRRAGGLRQLDGQRQQAAFFTTIAARVRRHRGERSSAPTRRPTALQRLIAGQRRVIEAWLARRSHLDQR